MNTLAESTTTPGRNLFRALPWRTRASFLIARVRGRGFRRVPGLGSFSRLQDEVPPFAEILHDADRSVESLRECFDAVGLRGHRKESAI